jgi:two-component system LytT family sensor kinase
MLFARHTMFNHPYRYLFILLLSLYAFLNTVLCEVYYYFKIDVSWYVALLAILGLTFFTWEGNRLAEPFFQKRYLISDYRVRAFIFFFIAGNVIALFAAAAIISSFGILLYSYSWNELINPLKLNFIYAVLINLFFHLLNTIFYFFNENRRRSAEAEELRHINSQAQIQLIKSQINPHFLFNNLNVLSGMVIRDNPQANKFIEEFSKVYRYLLNNQNKELIELWSELEFVHPYIFLLKKRFEDALQVQIDIPDRYKSRFIVPASLQMLIENAIKHNVVSRNRPLIITIHVDNEDALIVINNLQPRTISEPSTRIGLENIRKRYELISGRSVIVKKNSRSFEVALPLLILNQDHHENNHRGR